MSAGAASPSAIADSVDSQRSHSAPDSISSKRWRNARRPSVRHLFTFEVHPVISQISW